MAAALNQGYDDERFESVVSKNYHCIICFNVFKDPVMCRNNEHLFCRACITEHLTNSKNCPMCMDELTIDTLREAPRFVTGCLAELKIRCEYFNRGCGFIELEKLENHVKECDYAPVVCSNEGCNLEMNKRDLIHHETAVCEQRRVKCHNCGQMQQELKKVNAKLDDIEKRFAQLNETLKQMNANLAAQNDKLVQLETREAQHRSLELNVSEFKSEIEDESILDRGKMSPETESEASESEDESERLSNWPSDDETGSVTGRPSGRGRLSERGGLSRGGGFGRYREFGRGGLSERGRPSARGGPSRGGGFGRGGFGRGGFGR